MIRLQNVNFGYGEGPAIFKNVNLHLKPGSFHFLTGPSGAGKSTLLRLITMSLPPSSGTYLFFGEDVSKVTPAHRAMLRRKMGFVFQEFLMLDYLTVFENVSLPLHILGMKPAEYAADVNDLLEWVGLDEKRLAYPQTLSGGEKQRAAIARSIIGKPEVLLADEPTGSVDPVMARRLLLLFLELNRLGTTVVLATHDQRIVRRVPKSQIEIRDGALITSAGSGVAHEPLADDPLAELKKVLDEAEKRPDKGTEPQ